MFGYKQLNFTLCEEQIEEIKKYYVLQINRGTHRHGSLGKLSIALGYSREYMSRVLTRGSFSALRRVVKKIYDMGV